jgi:DNA mismatch endonuclease (patch repair protein)
MPDVVDKETRSRMMAGIRGKDTQPERVLRSALHRRGLRYRLHFRGLPGRPDIVFPKFRAVIFVHGCFWHRHEGCRYATTPASNAAFWKTKFDSNVSRDQRNIEALLKAGWRVAIVWECELRSSSLPGIAEQLTRWLKSDRSMMNLPAQVGLPRAARR